MAKVFDRVAIDSWLRDEVVQKFPRGGLGDIRLGSPVIVNPGEVAIFVRQGKSMGTLEQGTHVLTTANVPWLTDFVEDKLFGGKNVFTADIYFIKVTPFSVPWGTQNPMIVRHSGLPPGGSAIVGNGTFRFRVKDPWQFLMSINGFKDSVRLKEVADYIKPEVTQRMTSNMTKLVYDLRNNDPSFDPFSFPAYTTKINGLLLGILQPEFDAEGLELADMNINLMLHEDNIELITKAGIVELSSGYVAKQQADAFRDAAQNEAGGGGLAEIGMGMMGMSAAQQQMMMQQQMMQQQMQQQQAAAASGQQAPAGNGGNGGAMPDVMTPAQAAAIVQVTEADIVAAIEAGDLKARKIGSAYRISKANLEAFLSG